MLSPTDEVFFQTQPQMEFCQRKKRRMVSGVLPVFSQRQPFEPLARVTVDSTTKVSFYTLV
jgi:hypothetical protein